MKRLARLAAVLAITIFVSAGGSLAFADGVTGVAVQPLTPRPGDVIKVKGDLLGPNGEVEVRVIGAGVDVDLGEVETDDEGDFKAEFRLPADLKPGTYQVRAIGAKAATTQITVVGGAGAAATEAMAAPVLRERPLPEASLLVAIFGVVAALGLFLARTVRPASKVDGGRPA
jgi:hypothetical protein